MNATDPPPSSDEWTCEGQADILELLPRPRALDLGCGAGGASMGYYLAAYTRYLGEQARELIAAGRAA